MGYLFQGKCRYRYVPYDLNGNMITDSRKTLEIQYNPLNLVQQVKKGGNVHANYTFLADGTKLRVREGNSMNGYEYIGSMVFRKSSAGLQLETVLFENGVIQVNRSGNNITRNVNYFLKDHLGSIRAIINGSGVVWKETIIILLAQDTQGVITLKQSLQVQWQGGANNRRFGLLGLRNANV